jgi:hypothetical protein
MKPNTLRNVGTFAIGSGVIGLLALVALVALAGPRPTEPPQSWMVVVVPVQSVVNIVIGWTLRRQAAQLSG